MAARTIAFRSIQHFGGGTTSVGRSRVGIYLDTFTGFIFGVGGSEPMPLPREDDWRSRLIASPFRASVCFDGDDLVLGYGTVLYKLGAAARGSISLRPDAAHDRRVVLLAVAGRGRVAKAALAQLAAALDDWRRGDRGLAAIRLAFAPLPRLRDRDDAYSLFLAETALDAGLSPNDLLKALGYSACTALLKFDPDQPRVPAGSGSRSGQWTSGGGADGVTAPPSPRPAPRPSNPTPSNDEGIGPIPIFFRPDSDGEDEVIQDKERRLGVGETEDERIQEGREFRFPIPGGIGSSTPGLPDPSAPTAPEAGTVPIPRLAPSPGNNGSAPPSDTPDDKGPACPEKENDVPNGPNPSGDEKEYTMSLQVNPENPTPKYSAATPDVVSQAYFLPSDTALGWISFDDCKQGTTPTPIIPGLKQGDFVEYKTSGWGWVLFNDWTAGYTRFLKQVENQNAAVVSEGVGRQIYYCLGSQVNADRANKIFKDDYPNSHFLACN